MPYSTHMPTALSILKLLPIPLACLGLSAAAGAQECKPSGSGEKSLFWGDLHVHTSYSLDANVFGTLASPADAYRFAKGAPLARADGSTVQLERPLDFVAVTEHAEWLDFTSLCDSGQAGDFKDCRNLLENRSPGSGPALFQEYVVTSITGPKPIPLQPCADNPALCQALALDRWRAIRAQTDAANEPCRFTALHGFEWSHTPDFKHAHRNVIFRTDAVTEHAIDYIHFPTIEALWDALDKGCELDKGCQALAIPHNTNMGDGISFETADVSTKLLKQRAHYERLIEITQEKGTSECLSPYRNVVPDDCDFELFLTRQSRPTTLEDYTTGEWQAMRSTYARSLVGRGLAFPGDSAPLRLGFIGSTDTHAATPGYVDEHVWSGSALAGNGFDGAMLRKHWSAGGLVGVWADENTREGIFDALHRREVYATSGPRIGLRFGVDNIEPSLCKSPNWQPVANMGEVTTLVAPPVLSVQTQSDTAPIATIEIIKLTLQDGETQEDVITIWQETEGSMNRCVNWQDAQFDPEIATLWYPRVRQQPTPRWSAVQCARVGRCDEVPEADIAIQERAWGSPIWHIPEAKYP